MDNNNAKLVRKSSENRSSVEKQKGLKMKAYPTEELLGDMRKTAEFGTFFNIHKDDLKVIRMGLLMDYVEGSFTEEQMKAFRLGVNMFYGFFEAASSDMDAYTAEISKTA
jgi:hypothetical protein